MTVRDDGSRTKRDPFIELESVAGGEQSQSQSYSTRVDTRAATPGPREAFLNQLDGDLVCRRNPLAQLHHQAARNFGAKTFAEIRAYVRGGVRQRAVAQWESPAYRDKWRRVLVLLNTEPPEWAAYCSYILDYERLPELERERIKSARGEEHRIRWMRSQPATEKQIDYLRSLGYRGEVESKAHASELIDRLRGGAGR